MHRTGITFAGAAGLGLTCLNRATTGPGDTSETEAEQRGFALFGAPGVWGSPLQTHTPGALYSTVLWAKL